MKINEEKNLISEILKGDERSLRFFYNYFYPRVFTYIKRRIEDEKCVEEVMQDTFLAVLEGLRDFSFRSSLFTFICSIANHKIVDYYRRKKIKDVVFSHIPAAESFFTTVFGPEENLDEKLIRKKIEETFKKIAPKYEKILKLKYVYGYSVAEIAKKLSISFKSAESQLFRARRAFVAAYSL